MRISMKWLTELVPVSVPVPEFVDRLDMTGTAVETVHMVGDAFENVVIGQITKKDRHPNADKLWVTAVDAGEDALRAIVCGAQNFEAGDRVAVALPGAVLPGGFEIKKSKLRGVVSEGMNCSAKELGLGDDHDGILILPEDAPIGTPFAEYAGLSDIVLELEVTPNRPDCLSVSGIAREVGAVLGVPVKLPATTLDEAGPAAAEQCHVRIEDDRLCPRYTARIIKGVRVGPSPSWLAERVVAAGLRPVNNIVDITNYIMLELGQPLHAFDMGMLKQGLDGKAEIIVRLAAEGEELTTLDGTRRELAPRTLCICDLDGPVALAGVMGGQATEVSDKTVDILLESASFDAESISRTSRQLGLISESSMRYERTVDRSGCAAAADRAAALMAEIAGGEVATGLVDVFPEPLAERTLTLRLSRLTQIIGAEIPAEEAASILERLGCSVEKHLGGAGARPEGRPDDSSDDRPGSRSGDYLDAHLKVGTPSFRPDLEREIDLIEEVLRIYGMGQIEPTLPAGRERVGLLTRGQRMREHVGALLRAAGLSETMTYSFTDPHDLELLGFELPLDECVVEILNPMSVEQGVMRRTLLGGLLRMVSYNQCRGVDNIHLYETGTVFWTAPGRRLAKERERVAGVLAGSWNRQQWNASAQGLDFFDGKGVLETLARDLAAPKFKLRPTALPWLQPGRAAEVLVSGDVIGWLGDVHPGVLKKFECSGPVIAFELEIDRLIRSSVIERSVVEPPRFPAVSFDLAVLVEEKTTAEQLVQIITSAGGKLLESAHLFDVYRGTGVPEGKKSMAFSLTYRLPDRTLTSKEVEAVHSKIVRKVLAATGGGLRS
ncbi:MAG: phenylalanine--tRNA ligase subunit beta [Coriobacteriia bacterium]|nr:phenylalanine--tRNA ligase subunit beta [Coriobacteriia bacterium]